METQLIERNDSDTYDAMDELRLEPRFSGNTAHDGANAGQVGELEREQACPMRDATASAFHICLKI